MLRSGTVNTIREMAVQGKPIRTIAKELGLARNTVRKYLRGAPTAQPRPRRASKLDPYKDLIVCWLEKHPYSSMQILQRLRTEHGYTGGRSMVQGFIAKVRPVRQKAFLKLAFEAGDCLQIDWGTNGLMRIGEGARKLH